MRNKSRLEKHLQEISDQITRTKDDIILNSLGREYIHFQLIYMKEYGYDFRPKKL